MPQERVIRNSARIVAAATEAAAVDGWSALTPTAVGRRCGLSQRAVQTRFPKRPDLGAAAWRDVAGPALCTALHGALRSAGLFDEPGSASALRSALEQIARPNTELLAAAELLVISTFDSTVHDAVEPLRAQIAAWCTPQPGQVTRAQAARRAYLLMTCVGLLAAGRRPALATLKLNRDFDRLFTALHTPAPPATLPRARPIHATATTPFDTGDSIHDALLVSTLEHVGRLGFDGSTTMMIATAAGVSETTIFLRYPTKLDLFIDAAARQQAIAFRANEEFTARMKAAHGPAIAEAVELREFMHPDLAHQRAIYAEEVRISWHDAELQQRQEAEIDAFVAELRRANPNSPRAMSPAHAHFSYAQGVGLALFPLLAPDAWSLPFHLVTQPMHDVSVAI